MKKKLANCQAIDQTYITYSCIPGESCSKVALDSQPLKKPEKGCAKLTRFKGFPGCVMTLVGQVVFVPEGATGKCLRQKPCEMPLIKEFIFQ